MSAPLPSVDDDRFARLAKRSWQLLGVAGAVVVVAIAVSRLRLVVLPVILALFAASLLIGPSTWLRGRGLPPALAALAAMLAAVLALLGLGTLVAPAVVDELDSVGTSVQEGIAEVVDWLAGGPLGITEAEIDRAVERAVAGVRDSAGSIGRGALTGAIVLAEVVSGLLLAAVLVFFFLRDGDRMWRWLVAQLPSSRRAVVDDAGHRSWTVLSGYLRGIAVIATVDSLLIGLALLAIGVPLVLPLMVLTFFGAFLPVVGALLAGLVAVLVALVTQGPLAAGLVLAAIVVIQQLEGDLLYPLVVGRVLELHPVAILLALPAGAVLAGVAGAFLAVPAAAVVWTVVTTAREHRGSAAQEEPRADGEG